MKSLFKFNIHKYYIYRNINKLNNFIKLNEEYKLIIFEDINKLKKYKFKLINLESLREGILNKAIAFCIIFKDEIIHITWVAQNNNAKKFVDDLPTNFSWDKSALWGRSYTNINHRNKNLYSFTQQELQKYLYKKNITYQYFSIKIKNKTSIQAMNKFNPEIIKVVYRVNFFIFRFKIYINK